jgi:hypothetical protein
MDTRRANAVGELESTGSHTHYSTHEWHVIAWPRRLRARCWRRRNLSNLDDGDGGVQRGCRGLQKVLQRHGIRLRAVGVVGWVQMALALCTAQHRAIVLALVLALALRAALTRSLVLRTLEGKALKKRWAADWTGLVDWLD